MVTTTTPCFEAMLTPSYQVDEPEPDEKPPPCSQTRTGRLAPSRAGDQTLRTRQSSPGPVPEGRLLIRRRGVASARSVGESSRGGNGAVDAPWGDQGPNATASLTPVHGSGGRGARKRLGGAVE